MNTFFIEIVRALLDPLSLSFVLLTAGFIIYFIKKQNKISKVLYAFSIIWASLWSQPYFVDLLLYPLEYHLPNKIKQQTSLVPSNAKYIHVLACFYDGRTTRPFVSRWAECSHQRMVEAIRLHNQYDIPIIITGGGHPLYTDAAYASFAEEYLLSMGVDSKQVITLKNGTNTKTEVAALVTKLAPEKLIVVSSATHIFRINKLYQQHGVQTVSFPVDHLTSGFLQPYLSLPTGNSLESARRAFYEYMALLKHYFTS